MSSERRNREQGGAVRFGRRTFLTIAAGAAGAGAGAEAFASHAEAAAKAESDYYFGARVTPAAQQVGVPPITVTTPALAGTSLENILLTPSPTGSYQHGNLVTNSTGDIIKFLSFTDVTTNLQMAKYQGEPVLVFWKGQYAPPGYGIGVYKILDANYRLVKTVRAGNGLRGDLHEFLLLPGGTAFCSAYRARQYDLSSVGGPRNGTLLDSYFQEIDVTTGKVILEWRASDHVEVSESYMPVPTRPSVPYDFFHLNSVDVDTDGNIIVSARHCFCVYKLDRSTGNVIWRLHGKHSDFKMMKGTKFFWQHHARHHPGNVLTLFDDGAGATFNESHSRGLKLKLRYDSMTCELVQAYEPHPTILAASQGSVQVLENGNVFVGWGNQPYFSEYSSDGRLLYCGKLPNEVFSYRAFRAPWPPS